MIELDMMWSGILFFIWSLPGWAGFFGLCAWMIHQPNNPSWVQGTFGMRILWMSCVMGGPLTLYFMAKRTENFRYGFWPWTK